MKILIIKLLLKELISSIFELIRQVSLMGFNRWKSGDLS